MGKYIKIICKSSVCYLLLCYSFSYLWEIRLFHHLKRSRVNCLEYMNTLWYLWFERYLQTQSQKNKKSKLAYLGRSLIWGKKASENITVRLGHIKTPYSLFLIVVRDERVGEVYLEMKMKTFSMTDASPSGNHSLKIWSFIHTMEFKILPLFSLPHFWVNSYFALHNIS